MQVPDIRWLDFLKVTYGFVLLVILAALAAIIALGRVQEATSFGLHDIITVIGVLAGMFAQWAFGSTQGKKE